MSPTTSVQDPAVRQILDEIRTLMDQRSGALNSDDGQRFITKEEFNGLAGEAIVQAFSPGSAAGSDNLGASKTASEVGRIVDGLAESIRGSLVQQVLELSIPSPDLTGLQSSVDLAFGEANMLIASETNARVLADANIVTSVSTLAARTTTAESAITSEQTARASADSAITTSATALAARTTASEAAIVTEQSARASADGSLTTSLNALTTRTGNAESAIATELTTRSSKDDTLASAVNNIWSVIGGSTAVIQDGALAAISPSAAVATKWSMVQAAVTDPNTGLVNSTSIKQDLNAYANNANGRFASVYTVRAQVSVGGQTVVGGFGLAASTSAGGIGGPTGEGALIDFGVRADRFFIAATSATPDALTQIAQGPQTPFMVLTSSQSVNGVMYAPGVYIKKAVIGAATIGSAEIADAAITNAKIVNAAITSAKIADASITTAKIVDASITTAKIVDASIGSAKIADASITTAKIVDASIGSAKIADAAITNAKIGNAAITTAKIQDLAVDTLQLAGQAVTIPVGVFTAAAIDAIGGPAYTLQTLSFVSTGAPVVINGGCFLLSAGDLPSTVTITLRRGGVDLLSSLVAVPANIVNGKTTFVFPPYVDTPGAGSVSYSMIGAIVSRDCSFSDRGMTALEVKR